jgi:hypothetical protein
MFPSVYLFFFFLQGPSQVLSWRSCCYPFWGHFLSIAIFFSLQWYWYYCMRWKMCLFWKFCCFHYTVYWIGLDEIQIGCYDVW